MKKIQKINEDYYNKHAVDWTNRKTDSFYAEKEFRQFIKFLKKGDTVVDIGCANGLAIPLFIGIGCKLKYEGVDISSELLKIAKSRYPNFRFCKSSILEESTLPKKKYAGFWAAATLQHIPKPDWPLMLGNIEKIIKTGGIGYVSLPEQRLGISSGVDTRHFSLFTKKEFANLIYQRKWTILKTGFLPGTQRSAVWRWFIVQLP